MREGGQALLTGCGYGQGLDHGVHCDRLVLEGARLLLLSVVGGVGGVLVRWHEDRPSDCGVVAKFRRTLEFLRLAAG